MADQALNLQILKDLLRKRIVTARQLSQVPRTGASRATGFRTHSDPVQGLSEFDDVKVAVFAIPRSSYELASWS